MWKKRNTQTHTHKDNTLTYAPTSFTSSLLVLHVDCADTNTPLTHCPPHICTHTSNVTSSGMHTKRHKYYLPLCHLYTPHPYTHTHTHITHNFPYERNTWCWPSTVDYWEVLVCAACSTSCSVCLCVFLYFNVFVRTISSIVPTGWGHFWESEDILTGPHFFNGLFGFRVRIRFRVRHLVLMVKVRARG